jgi:hypothetical protein
MTKITAGKSSQFKEGSARAKLLALAIKSGSVEKFLARAGEPSGGPAKDYLSMFARMGLVKFAKSAGAGR